MGKRGWHARAQTKPNNETTKALRWYAVGPHGTGHNKRLKATQLYLRQMFHPFKNKCVIQKNALAQKHLQPSLVWQHNMTFQPETSLKLPAIHIRSCGHLTNTPRLPLAKYAT